MRYREPAEGLKAARNRQDRKLPSSPLYLHDLPLFRPPPFSKGGTEGGFVGRPGKSPANDQELARKSLSNSLFFKVTFPTGHNVQQQLTNGNAMIYVVPSIVVSGCLLASASP